MSDNREEVTWYTLPDNLESNGRANYALTNVDAEIRKARLG